MIKTMFKNSLKKLFPKSLQDLHYRIIIGHLRQVVNPLTRSVVKERFVELCLNTAIAYCILNCSHLCLVIQSLVVIITVKFVSFKIELSVLLVIQSQYIYGLGLRIDLE